MRGLVYLSHSLFLFCFCSISHRLICPSHLPHSLSVCFSVLTPLVFDFRKSESLNNSVERFDGLQQFKVLPYIFCLPLYISSKELRSSFHVIPCGFLTGCPSNAAVCKKMKSSNKAEALGYVNTQRMSMSDGEY